MRNHSVQFRASDYSIMPINTEGFGSEAMKPKIVLASRKCEPGHPWLGPADGHSLSVSTASIGSVEAHSPHRLSVGGGDWCGSEDRCPSNNSPTASSTASSTPAADQIFANPRQVAVHDSYTTPDVCLTGSPANSSKSNASDGTQHGAKSPNHQINELQQQLALARAQLKQGEGELDSCQAVAGARERELSQQVEQLRGERDTAWRRVQEAEGAHSAGLQEARQQLADSDSLVRQQAAVIAQMEQRLLQAKNFGPNEPVARQQLEAENGSLRQAVQALQSRLAGGGQPACDSSSGNSSEGNLVTELQARLARLQASMHLKEEQHQRQLSALRQEHERLRVQEGIRAANRASSVRVKHLEAKLEQVQEAAAKRLRALESRLREANATSKAVIGGAPSNGLAARPPAPSPQQGGSGRALGAVAAASRDGLAAATTQLQQKEQRIRRLESELARKEAEAGALAARMAHADAELTAAAEAQLAMASQAAALQQAMDEAMAANEGLHERVQQIPALQQQLVGEQQGAQDLRQQLEKLHAQAAEEAARRDEEQAAQLRSLQHEQEMAAEAARLDGLEVAAKEWQPKLVAAEEAAAEWRRQLEAAEVQLRSARAGVPWTPTAADFVRLEQRMSESEHRARQREAQWLCVAEEKRQAAQRGTHRDCTITSGMRPQLDGVLAAARLLA